MNAACQVPGGPVVFGSDNNGIFVSSEDGFIYQSNGGLLENTSIKRLSVKKNTYKNGAVKYFIFAATDKGLYRSEDNGYNWVLMTGTGLEYQYAAMH